MDLGLTGSTYLVTGGSGGLGRATAEVLVAEGAQVVVSGRTRETLDELTAALGEGAHGVVADNADPDAADRLVAAALERFGGLDGALVSVGGPAPGSVMDTPDDAWTRGFETVFLGAVRVARAVARSIVERGGEGSLAFVLSSSVRAPIPGLSVSNGLRPGLAMVAKSLADELGPQGVRVNGLLPGRVDTARVRELDAAGGDPEGARQRNEQSIPLRRYGLPEEFGRAAAFLLSPASSFVSGAMLPVDGGMLRAL